MKKIIIPILIFTSIISAHSQTVFPSIVMETSMGKMVIILYDDTPMHAENIIKLVRDGFYDGQLFHRVIKDFMIQTGDPDTKNAKSGVRYGSGGPSYTIPAEFVLEYYHKKGALAAARQGDNINPKKASSGSQFYIVQGKKLTDAELDAFEQRGLHIPFTPEQREVYKTSGGSPHLDYSYTVFGEVTEGLEIIDNIAAQATDSYDRPLEDVKIVRMYIAK